MKYFLTLHHRWYNCLSAYAMKSQETCGTGHTKKDLAFAAMKSCFSCTYFNLAPLGAGFNLNWPVVISIVMYFTWNMFPFQWSSWPCCYFSIRWFAFLIKSFSFYETDCDTLQKWKQWSSSPTFSVNNPRINYSKTEQMNSNSLVPFWCSAFRFVQSH